VWPAEKGLLPSKLCVHWSEQALPEVDVSSCQWECLNSLEPNAYQCTLPMCIFSKIDSTGLYCTSPALVVNYPLPLLSP